MVEGIAILYKDRSGTLLHSDLWSEQYVTINRHNCFDITDYGFMSAAPLIFKVP